MCRTLFGAVAFAGTVMLSSCSGSPFQRSTALPEVRQAQSRAAPAATSPVTITEYNVLRGPQNPTIGPDGAVWFGAAGPNSSGPIYVYRFAANDGQGRFYALSSLLHAPNSILTGAWSQTGPLVSFAGRMWISFDAQTQDFADLDSVGGLIQMTAGGTAIDQGIDAGVIYGGLDIGGTAVQGDRLWLLPTNYRSTGGSSIRSYTFTNGALKQGPTFYIHHMRDVIVGYALRAGPDGNIYALFQSFDFRGVYKLSPSALRLGSYQINNFNPVDMAFGSDGAMWITTAPYIMRMTTNGTRALYTLRIPGSVPTAITLGHDGAMWFVDAGTNAIGRITTTGSITEYPVPTRNAFSSDPYLLLNGIVACPVGVARCGSGDIWFTEPNTNKLGRIHINS